MPTTLGQYYITLWQWSLYMTAMLGSPDSQSDTAVDTGCMENKLFGHSHEDLRCLITVVIELN